MINLYLFHNNSEILDKHSDYSELLFCILRDLSWIYDSCADESVYQPIEHIIKRDAHVAYAYAQIILKRRWPEAEPYIMKDPNYAYTYARDVIKGKWLEAEPTIMTNRIVWYLYKRDCPSLSLYIN